MKLYTFSIHDADRDVPLFSCIAGSERHAIAKCRALGYQDFTLTETMELDADEIHERVLASITTNPFVGLQWLPFIDAASILIESRELNRREATWSFDFYRLTADGKAERPFFVQGLVEMDGSMHLELSGDVNREPRFTDEQITQLDFMGWAKMDNLEIYFIEFEPGWVPRYIGERMVEALASVHNVDLDHFFGFTIWEHLNDEIRALTPLVDVTINRRSGLCDLFALPGSAAIAWTERVRAEIALKEALGSDQTKNGTDDVDNGNSNEVIDEKEIVHMAKGIVTREELQHDTVVDEWYNDDEWSEFTVDAAVFRWSDGEIVLEVLPKIFLPFSPTKVPDIEDFFHHAMPWMHIDSAALHGDIVRKRFHPSNELREFMHFFARSVYGDDGAPVPSPLDLDDVGQRAQIVARGVFGAFHHDNGDYLINRASSMRWIVEDLEHDFGKRDIDDETETFVAHALLSMVPDWGTRYYYRPLTADDLEGWGLPTRVLRSLDTLWPAATRQRSVTDSPGELVSTRLDSGFRALRLAELIMQWSETRHAIFPDVTEKDTGLVFEMGWGDKDPRVPAIVREASRLLASNDADAARWLTNRAQTIGEHDQIDYLRPRITEAPGKTLVEQTRQSVQNALKSDSPSTEDVDALRLDERVAIAIIAKVLERTGEARIHEKWLPPEGPIEPKFEDDLDQDELELDDLPAEYVTWLAERVIGTLHLMGRGFSMTEVSTMWSAKHFQSERDQLRIDDLCFASLFLDLWYRGDVTERIPGLTDNYLFHLGGDFKLLLHFVWFRRPPYAEIAATRIYSPPPRLPYGDGVELDGESLHHIMDTALYLTSDVAVKFGKNSNWRVQFSGDLNCVNISISALIDGSQEARYQAKRLQVDEFGPVTCRAIGLDVFDVTCRFTISSQEFNHDPFANRRSPEERADRLSHILADLSGETELHGKLDTNCIDSRMRIFTWW